MKAILDKIEKLSEVNFQLIKQSERTKSANKYKKLSGQIEVNQKKIQELKEKAGIGITLRKGDIRILEWLNERAKLLKVS